MMLNPLLKDEVSILEPLKLESDPEAGLRPDHVERVRVLVPRRREHLYHERVPQVVLPHHLPYLLHLSLHRMLILHLFQEHVEEFGRAESLKKCVFRIFVLHVGDSGFKVAEK